MEETDQREQEIKQLTDIAVDSKFLASPSSAYTWDQLLERAPGIMERIKAFHQDVLDKQYPQHIEMACLDRIFEMYSNLMMAFANKTMEQQVSTQHYIGMPDEWGTYLGGFMKAVAPNIDLDNIVPAPLDIDELMSVTQRMEMYEAMSAASYQDPEGGGHTAEDCAQCGDTSCSSNPWYENPDE